MLVLIVCGVRLLKVAVHTSHKEVCCLLSMQCQLALQCGTYVGQAPSLGLRTFDYLVAESAYHRTVSHSPPC